jgi:hypothetical protein
MPHGPTYNLSPMRACLLALLMLFCLPLLWAGSATGALCAHASCAARHADRVDVPAQAAEDDALSESHAQHAHCGSCHSGAAAVSAAVPFVLHAASNRLPSGPKCWVEVLLTARPERPQWPTLA